ncbi:hypothetical protein ABH945_001195 [Paraburkholderia sp. GAS333]
MSDCDKPMKCDCHDQPAIRRIDGVVPKLFPGFRLVDTAHWRALVRCPMCGQLWAVDEWDKYQIQFAVKVEDAKGWNASDEALRKEYLVQSRGENATAKCMWNGCEKNQLNGSAYCVDHLYATGART